MGKLYLSAPANFLLLPSQVLASYHSTLVGFDGGKSCIPTNYEYDLIFSPLLSLLAGFWDNHGESGQTVGELRG